MSSSLDSTVKVWDLRQGHILYTLYGHEGSGNSVSFSPSGDYFSSGGDDSVVMIWKSNLNQFEQELIDDFGGKTTAVTAASKAAEQEQSSKRTNAHHRTTAQMSQTAKCPGPSAQKAHCHSLVHEKPNEFASTFVPQEDGVSGSGEELTQTLEKVVS